MYSVVSNATYELIQQLPLMKSRSCLPLDVDLNIENWLEKIINLLFVALKGSLPSQWGVWGLQNDEGKCWQNITSGFLCQEKQLNLKSVLYFRANFPVCPPCWPAGNI